LDDGVRRFSGREQSGELEQMLDRVAIAYDEEIDIATERMTAVIEPIMITVLGVIIGTIVTAMYLPLYSILNKIG